MGDDETLVKSGASAGAALAKEVYGDLAQPSAAEIGDALGRTVHHALAPLRGTLWTLDQAERWLEKAVRGILEKRGAANVASPPAETYLLCAAGCQTAPDELRQMFAELLASSMDPQRATTHPSYAQIIGQLSVDEALALRWWRELGVEYEDDDGVERFFDFTPVLSLSVQADDGVGRSTWSYFAWDAPDARHPQNVDLYTANLHRLGIIIQSAPGHSHEATEALGLSSRSVLPNLADEVIYMERIEYPLSSFGQRFALACVPDIDL